VDDRDLARILIRTSSARKFATTHGVAIWARNPARSTSEPSGLLFMKSSARFSSNQRTSDVWTDRM
jgi:hypothetical protein